MNPPELYYISPEQRQKYLVQPDMIPNGDRILDGTHEHVQVVKSSSMRFWYNVQPAGFASHWHTALEIIMPLEGNYVAHILSETYVLEPGDIFIIPAGTIHSLEAPPEGSRLIYILEPNFLAQLPGFNYVQSLLSQPMRITYDDDPDYYAAEAKLILLLADYYWSQSATKAAPTGILPWNRSLDARNTAAAIPQTEKNPTVKMAPGCTKKRQMAARTKIVSSGKALWSLDRWRRARKSRSI